MLLNVYLYGWLVTTIGALVAVNRLSDRRRSRARSLGSLAVLAGVLWPVLVVGAVELIAIVLVARRMRAASARESDQAMTSMSRPVTGVDGCGGIPIDSRR